MATFIKKKQANPLNQIGAMKSKFPQFQSRKKGDNIVFTGDLFVKPELPVYNISIEYKGNLRPTVNVISPALVEKPPHTFADKSLCLYHSDNFKWSTDKLIAKEIMQWTIAWIYFYEYWLQTGEWIAPEVQHSTEKKMNKKVPFKNKFDTAKKYDTISTYLLYFSTILLIFNFILGNISDFPLIIIRSFEVANCLAIILFAISEFVVNYTHFEAESHRREDFVDNSFASLIAENRTEGYYTNDDLKSGLYKMGVNNFESCFFSYNIAKKDLPFLWSKTILISLIFITIAICGYDKWLIFIIQLTIPIVLLQQSIKHTLFVSRLKNVLCRYRSLFSTLKKSKTNDSEIIRDILEYEATIAWGNMLLDEKTYNKMNAILSDEWKNLKKEYSIQ